MNDKQLELGEAMPRPRDYDRDDARGKWRGAVYLDGDIARRFASECAISGLDASAAIEEAVVAWLEGRGA